MIWNEFCSHIFYIIFKFSGEDGKEYRNQVDIIYYNLRITFTKMPACKLCKKMQSKLNSGSLCRACFEQQNEENKTDDDQLLLGFTEQEINGLPELPNDWINEPFRNLMGGHLLKIILMANNTINQKIDKLNNRIATLENSLKVNTVAIEKNKDEIDNNVQGLSEVENTTAIIKKTLINQQIFIEQVQRNNLVKNLMISGISNENMLINGNELVDTNQKVIVILKQLDDSLNENDYELKKFDPPDGKETHLVKIIMNDIDKKKKILTEAKTLKDMPGLDSIYIKNDETKLSRGENYRLRQKARSLRLAYPGVDIKIEKGILKHDGVMVDKYDLNNQIFC